MGTSIDAIFFYGYAEPIDEEQHQNSYAHVDVWGRAYDRAHNMFIEKQKKPPCYVGCYGVSGYMAYFLAIREVYFKASSYTVHVIRPAKLTVNPEWDSILQDAAKEWKIDLTGLTPGWYLAPLFLG